MNSLYDLSSPVEMRWINPENPTGARGKGGSANFGRKGSPCLLDVAPGQLWTMAAASGVGTVRRLWITVADRSPEVLRGIVLRFYWDGAATPAIEAPLGDFFGCPLGRMMTYASEWFDTAEGRNFNCRLPMPFRTGFKVTAENQTDRKLGYFWYHLDYSLGDAHDEHTGYLHAHYRRENPTRLRQDFEILPRVRGRGRYLGASLGVIADTGRYGREWWGEGEVKIYLDGDTDLPTLCGTGAEDYICTSWGQGQFCLPWYGSPLADGETMQYALYRFHGFDPIFFQQEIRVTIQQIGFRFGERLARHRRESGLGPLVVCGDGSGVIPLDEMTEDSMGLFERSDDWCATAYFYLDRPEDELPAIEDYAARIKGLTAADIGQERLDV